jgi:hypothetical protein
MPQTTASTSQASNFRAQLSQPTCEQREIIFETTFDINGDFKNFEATQWAIQEFTGHGLKKLFKPITSTSYTKLVVQFYTNLYTNCNMKGVLFSTVQRKQVEMTTADIATTLKCNDEHPLQLHKLMHSRSPFISLKSSKTCVQGSTLMTKIM